MFQQHVVAHQTLKPHMELGCIPEAHLRKEANGGKSKGPARAAGHSCLASTRSAPQGVVHLELVRRAA